MQCGQRIAKELHEWESKICKMRIECLFFVEEGTKHYGQMEQIFKRDGIPLPVRVPKSTAQVQPSDILAWEAFRWMKDGNPSALGRTSIDLPGESGSQQNFGAIFLEKDLRSLCTETKVMTRSTLRPGDTISFTLTKKEFGRGLSNSWVGHCNYYHIWSYLIGQVLQDAIAISIQIFVLTQTPIDMQ